MESEQEPDPADNSAGPEVEDIPSDFFDEFNKDEFIEGLSVIDSWDDEDKGSHVARPRKESMLLDSDKDFSDIHTEKTSGKHRKRSPQRSPSNNQLDEYIKPGSRRDPNKTNQAIKKDKEEKVKEFLAKSLESSDDLRPPGTELDDYYTEHKTSKSEKTHVKEEYLIESPLRSRSREYRPRNSPVRPHRFRESPTRPQYRTKWSPRHSPRRTHRWSPRRSPRRNQWQPYNTQKFSRPNFKHFSPVRRSPRRFSPRRSPRRHSPHRSPRRSPRRARRSRSRSPYKHSRETRRSRSRSPSSKKLRDQFLYPVDSDLPPTYQNLPNSNAPYQYHSAVAGEFSGGPSYSYAPAYTGGYNNNPYEYGGPSGMLPSQPVSGPPMSSVPQQLANPAPVPMSTPITSVPHPVPAPTMVPAPNIVSPNIMPLASSQKTNTKTPYDALAKLVAEGKISKEDYLKLAPNKGSSSALETNQRVTVLKRCNGAIQSLMKLHLPNHLLMNYNILGMRPEPKYIAPKYCSPLKRQAPIEFLFTKANVAATARQNKHLVDSIISCLPELEKVVTRPKKKSQKNMKDAAVQTSKPYCDICEIRENTQFSNASTYIDPEHFSSTVYTQVVEQDLISSKAVFNPSGSVGDGAPMSIAHLTPAQLVSQLAARAKTLQQTDPPPSNQYRRPSSNNYSYDGRGGQQYQNYNNYRY